MEYNVFVFDATTISYGKFFEVMNEILDNLSSRQYNTQCLGNALIVVTKFDLIKEADKQEWMLNWRKALAKKLPITLNYEVVFHSSVQKEYKPQLEYIASKGMIHAFCRGFILQFEQLFPQYRSCAKSKHTARSTIRIFKSKQWCEIV